MKHQDDINRLVVASLQTSGVLKARDIFNDVRSQEPQIFRRGFKSFVIALNSAPVEPILQKGKPAMYTLKK